jgi:hypothetical protein
MRFREVTAAFAPKCKKLFTVDVYLIPSLCIFLLKYEVDITL